MNLQIHIFAVTNSVLTRRMAKEFQGKDGWLINAVCAAGGLLPLGREGERRGAGEK